jgi:hypothetical protein
MLDRDVEEAIREGFIAMGVAERLADQESVVHCLNTIGSSMIVAGRVAEGREYLEKSLALARRMPSDSWVASAFGNLGTACGEVYRFDLAGDYLRRGIEFCAERGRRPRGWRGAQRMFPRRRRLALNSPCVSGTRGLHRSFCFGAV